MLFLVLLATSLDSFLYACCAASRSLIEELVHLPTVKRGYEKHSPWHIIFFNYPVDISYMN